MATATSESKPGTGEETIHAPEATAWRTLWARSNADRHPIAQPWLCPHLSAVYPDAGQVILYSDDRKFSLQSPLYGALIPLLISGRKSRDQIVSALHERYTADDVNLALHRLTERGFLVAHDDAMGRAEAGYWTALGVSPLAARAALALLPVSVVALAGEDAATFESAFRRLGGTIAAGPNDAKVLWILAESYLDRRLEDINSACLKNGRLWGVARLAGLRPLLGPLFRAGNGCWRCLASRLRGNLEVESFLSGLAAEAPADDAAPADTGMLAIPAAHLAALQLAKALVIEKGGINDGLLALNGLTGESTFHRFARLAHCSACGAPLGGEAISTGEPPIPAGPALPQVFTSGGYRRMEPADTLERFRHLCDPLTGIVSQMMPLAEVEDDWNHTYVATHRFSPDSMDFAQLRHGLRSKSSGKGSTRLQSMASAFGEAIERYSGIYQGYEAATRRRYCDFDAGEALHPNELMGFSERQYARRQEINRTKGRGPFRVAAPFDAEANLDWTAAWSLRDRRRVFVATPLAYYYAPSAGESACLPDSNGASAGNTIEEAIVQGFLELVERDAYALWWYNRLRVPGVSLAAFGDPYLDRADRYYVARHREIRLLDVSMDSDVTVFVAVSRRTDKAVEDVILGAGAHFDPRVAALRAVTEVNQHLFAVEDVDGAGRGYRENDPDRLAWWRQVSVAACPWLVATREQSPRPIAYPGDHGIAPCLAVAAALNVDLLVLDQTRAEAGMPVAKVMAPGLRHFWPRFAAGRLYDVPVKLGLLAEPLDETELTDIDVFV